MRSPRRVLFLAALLFAITPPSIHAQSAARLRVGLSGPAVEQGAVLGFHSSRRSGPNWKTGVVIGVGLGVLFGVAVASWDGDEGSHRSAGDRISSGLLAAGFVAVPATVIFALLFGED